VLAIVWLEVRDALYGETVGVQVAGLVGATVMVGSSTSSP
jgi:hypothetical protein